MNVLSLFDGISCGRIALDRAGIKVDNYYSSEIDKHAITVSEKNYPKISQLGDVCNWQNWNLPKIDLLIGGSPCQGFSRAGKQLNFDDPRSKLFFEFVDILKHYKPEYFLLENVSMKREFQDIITDQLGVAPITINSNLLSAQNRKRLYWTNIPNVELPKDKGITLSDIVDENASEELSLHIKWEEWAKKNEGFEIIDDTLYVGNDAIKIPFAMTERRTEEAKRIRREHKRKYGTDFCPRRGKELYPRKDSKMNCLTATYSVKEHSIFDLNGKYRKLTPLECERLQTVPDHYTSSISNSQRYKALGNGWTVDVIAHIFKNMKQ